MRWIVCQSLSLNFVTISILLFLFQKNQQRLPLEKKNLNWNQDGRSHNFFAESSGFQYKDESNIDERFGSLELTALWGNDPETKKIIKSFPAKLKQIFAGNPDAKNQTCNQGWLEVHSRCFKGIGNFWFHGRVRNLYRGKEMKQNQKVIVQRWNFFPLRPWWKKWSLPLGRNLCMIQRDNNNCINSWIIMKPTVWYQDQNDEFQSQNLLQNCGQFQPGAEGKIWWLKLQSRIIFKMKLHQMSKHFLGSLRLSAFWLEDQKIGFLKDSTSNSAKFFDWVPARRNQTCSYEVMFIRLSKEIHIVFFSGNQTVSRLWCRVEIWQVFSQKVHHVVETSNWDLQWKEIGLYL